MLFLLWFLEMSVAWEMRPAGGKIPPFQPIPAKSHTSETNNTQNWLVQNDKVRGITQDPFRVRKDLCWFQHGRDGEGEEGDSPAGQRWKAGTFGRLTHLTWEEAGLQRDVRPHVCEIRQKGLSAGGDWKDAGFLSDRGKPSHFPGGFLTATLESPAAMTLSKYPSEEEGEVDGNGTLFHYPKCVAPSNEKEDFEKVTCISPHPLN